MASLLIIGGSGFFGKSILDAYRRGLLSSWNIDSITVLARNAICLNAQFPELIDGSIKLVNEDITTCHELPLADYVIHAAASTDAADYIARPDVEKKNIQAGTYNYCKLAKKFHRDSRIVYCSSGAVYGQQPSNLEQLFEEFACGNVGEMAPEKRDYAIAKRDSEKAIIELGGAGLSINIARCFSFVGTYLPRDKHFAIGNFIEDGLRGRDIKINADHEVFRSYMHADDLVRWLLTIAGADKECVHAYNVGSDQAVSIIELGSIIGNFFGVNTISNAHTSSKVDRYIPSILKAKKDLKLQIEHDLFDSINKTIANVKY
jgi:nucleoside-diphosphate-sugar epimerase